jgi:hypothetical protein
MDAILRYISVSTSEPFQLGSCLSSLARMRNCRCKDARLRQFLWTRGRWPRFATHDQDACDCQVGVTDLSRSGCLCPWLLEATLTRDVHIFYIKTILFGLLLPLSRGAPITPVCGSHDRPSQKDCPDHSDLAGPPGLTVLTKRTTNSPHAPITEGLILGIVTLP